MGLARYLVEAVVLEGRSVTELARGHGVSRFWIYKLLARYREGGHPALEPRSRRAKSCSHQTAPEVEDEIVRLRAELTQAGFDAGPQTIVHHLQGRVPKLPSAVSEPLPPARSGPRPHSPAPAAPPAAPAASPAPPAPPPLRPNQSLGT